jgi:hypothetical protein
VLQRLNDALVVRAIVPLVAYPLVLVLLLRHGPHLVAEVLDGA